MRCEACDTELRPTARFCDGCGAPLRHVPPAARHAPREYTPRHLAEKILRQRSALIGEHKQVTVLFADVKGSMALAESLGPEAWHGIMNRFFEILAGVIHRFEGTVNQFTGDGVMALFGAPIAHEDHAQRACYAALRLREEMQVYAAELKRELGLNFSVRMGLNSGSVVVGRIGDDLRMDYTAQGFVVGLASRMEHLAEAGTAYLSESTAALVSGYCRLRDLGEFRVKGAREPVRVHQLLGEGPLRTRFDASRSRGLTRFIGRVGEMARLDTVLENARRGRGGVLGVVGEAGVGKSRLCFEFTERCRSGGILVRRAQAVAHGRMIPFLPVLEMLRGIFGISERDGDLEARRKIAGTVLLLDADLTGRLPLFFEFLGVADDETAPSQLDPEARQRRLIEAVMRLVRARGRREPAVFLFEDLHWIDPGSEAFLERLVEIAEETRTLVLANFRPEYTATWMRKPCYAALPLAPLGDAAVEELLDELLGGDSSTVALRAEIRQRAAGNPFFVEEVVSSLLDTGVLERSDDGCRLVRPIARLKVPTTVRAVLAARIDRLGETAKRLLQTAAVIGASFSETLLQRVVSLPDGEFRDALRSLVGAGFVHGESLHPVVEYAFKHPLTQEIAYQSQLAEQRAGIHASVLRELVELHPDRLDQDAALLAHHAESARQPLEAARWHGRAAEWVGIRDVTAAHRHWRAVLALVAKAPASPERDALELRAHVWLQQLAWRLGFSKQEAHRIFLSGAALTERTGDQAALVTLALGYAIYRGVIGDEAGQHRFGAEAAGLADELRSFPLALAARVVTATSLHFQGRLREAIDVANWAVARRPQRSEGEGDRYWISPYTYILGLRGALHALCGGFERASADLARALELARGSEDPEALGCVHGFGVQHARCTGEAIGALAHAREMLEVAERTGIPLLRVDGYLSLGSALVLSARWGDAVAALEQALEIADSRRILLGQKRRIHAVLAEAYLGLGEHERARHIAQELLAEQRPARALLVEIGAQLVLARALLRVEGIKAGDAVRSAISRASRLVDESGARSLGPEIHRARAEVAEHEGDRATRLRELRQAHRLYREMAAQGHADRMAGLVAELGDPE